MKVSHPEKVASPLAFFVLAATFVIFYALTAQRGLGWGDSGEFQNWVLVRKDLLCGDSIASSHPFYVWFARLFARTPYGVTLVSSFFGGMTVAGFYLCVRRILPAVLFGLSHMLWTLSCVAEVQTMSLAFSVFEFLCLRSFLDTRRLFWLVVLSLLAGLHLEIHNFALLALPIYAVVCLRALPCSFVGVRAAVISGLAFAIGASFWIYSAIVRGLSDVLVGRYGTVVSGFLPADVKLAAINLTLAAMSFFVPCMLLRWNWKAVSFRRVETALLAINALFFLRYFVPDQALFCLPTLLFLWLLVGDLPIATNRVVALALIQLVLPIFVWLFAGRLSLNRVTVHPYRDEAAYFALPWKFTDHSADRYAAELGGVWDGYPNCGGKDGKVK